MHFGICFQNWSKFAGFLPNARNLSIPTPFAKQYCYKEYVLLYISSQDANKTSKYIHNMAFVLLHIDDLFVLHCQT